MSTEKKNSANFLRSLIEKKAKRNNVQITENVQLIPRSDGFPSTSVTSNQGKSKSEVKPFQYTFIPVDTNDMPSFWISILQRLVLSCASCVHNITFPYAKKTEAECREVGISHFNFSSLVNLRLPFPGIQNILFLCTMCQSVFLNAHPMNDEGEIFFYDVINGFVKSPVDLPSDIVDLTYCTKDKDVYINILKLKLEQAKQNVSSHLFEIFKEVGRLNFSVIHVPEELSDMSQYFKMLAKKMVYQQTHFSIPKAADNIHDFDDDHDLSDLDSINSDQIEQQAQVNHKIAEQINPLELTTSEPTEHQYVADIVTETASVVSSTDWRDLLDGAAADEIDARPISRRRRSIEDFTLFDDKEIIDWFGLEHKCTWSPQALSMLRRIFATIGGGRHAAKGGVFMTTIVTHKQSALVGDLQYEEKYYPQVQAFLAAGMQYWIPKLNLGVNHEIFSLGTNTLNSTSLQCGGLDNIRHDEILTPKQVFQTVVDALRRNAFIDHQQIFGIRVIVVVGTSDVWLVPFKKPYLSPKTSIEHRGG